MAGEQGAAPNRHYPVSFRLIWWLDPVACFESVAPSRWVRSDVLLKMIEITDKSAHSDSDDQNHAAYGRGCKQYKVTNYYMAIAEFVAALEYWPEDPQAWMALGNCFDEIDKPKKAEYCYRRSVELSPENDKPKVRYNLANSIFDQYRYDEAIVLYRMIPEDDPVREQAQKNLQLAIDLRRKQAAEQDRAAKEIP